MAHGKDVISELTADHREVEEMFERIQAMPPSDPERKRLVDNATIELVRHAVAEEQYLYPAVREHVEEGNPLADKEITDHGRVERILKDLERRDVDDADFDTLVTQLVNEVSAHVRDEEHRLFPLLRAACSPEQLEKLGDRIRQAKRTAPTRPHPAAPHTPPANRLLAPGMGLVDRTRDALSGRGRS
ncbi:hemerythrin domain-containing protein [Streptomyces sp. XD-27]|uniref:hemerythrin domain-containing protein n=1 Tax=Streptomyces sp. XD-27 TaxID=3062779 RepID=UPI0026F40C58|nr:hemerythrin domain-containing protein [Streptomyces sp. XD-27]WKX73655.1 hemerythrin domain-containing protein [Streptomyces sp. XD-27]